MVNHQKSEQVAEYQALIKGCKSVFLADYMGLDVASLEDLRAKCRANDVQFTVVKNRLMRIAAAELGFEELGQYLKGPTAIAVSEQDEVSPAKVIATFAKVKKKPTLKAAVVDGAVYGPTEADVFANLPTLDEARSQLLSVFQAPASQLVRLLAAPSTQITRCIDARKDKLEG
jgi:large subunit ribosomal protein L10